MDKQIINQNLKKKETKNESFNRQKRNMFIIYGTGLVLLIIVMSYVKLYNKNIFLSNECLLNIKGWTLTHITLYTFLGYFAHSLWYILIIIGFIFEIIELIINSLFTEFEYRFLKDPIANTFGILIGIILYRIIPHKVDLYKNILNFFK